MANTGKQNRPIGQYFSQFEDPIAGQSQRLGTVNIKGIQVPQIALHRALDLYSAQNQYDAYKHSLPSRKDLSFVDTEIDPSMYTPLYEAQRAFKQTYHRILASRHRGRHLLTIDKIKGNQQATKEVTELLKEKEDALENFNPVNYENEFKAHQVRTNLLREIDHNTQRLTDLAEEKKVLEQDEKKWKEEWKQKQEYVDNLFIPKTTLNKIEHARLQERNPGVWKLMFGSKDPYAAETLAGSLTDFVSMLTIMGIPIIKKGTQAALKGTVGAGLAVAGIPLDATVAGIPVGVALNATGTALAISSVAELSYLMRQHEGYAEVAEAYEQRLDGLNREFRAVNNREPNEVEKKIIVSKASQGIQSLYNDEMLAFGNDLVQMAGMYATGGLAGAWKAPGLYKTFTGWSAASRNLAAAGTYGLGVWGNMAYEGVEEGQQYMWKDKFIGGYYDDMKLNRGWQPKWAAGVIGKTATDPKSFAQAWGRYWDITSESARGAWGVFTDDHIAGRTHTKEFRNAVKAGWSLGLGMAPLHYAGSKLVEKEFYVKEGVAFARKYKNAQVGELATEMNPFIADYLNNELLLARVQTMAGKYDEEGSTKGYGQLMKALKFMEEDDKLSQITTQEDLKLAKREINSFDKLWKRLKRDSGFKDLDNDEKVATLYSVLKAQQEVEYGKQGQMDWNKYIDELYSTYDLFEDNPVGKSINKKRNQLSALKIKMKMQEDTNHKVVPDAQQNIIAKAKAKSILEAEYKRLEKELNEERKDVSKNIRRTSMLDYDLVSAEARRFDSFVDEQAAKDHLKEIDNAQTTKDIRRIKEIASIQKGLKEQRKIAQKDLEDRIEFLSSTLDPNQEFKSGDKVRFGAEEAIYKGMAPDGKNAVVYFPKSKHTEKIPFTDLKKYNTIIEAADKKEEENNKNTNSRKDNKVNPTKDDLPIDREGEGKEEEGPEINPPHVIHTEADSEAKSEVEIDPTDSPINLNQDIYERSRAEKTVLENDDLFSDPRLVYKRKDRRADSPTFGQYIVANENEGWADLFSEHDYKYISNLNIRASIDFKKLIDPKEVPELTEETKRQIREGREFVPALKKEINVASLPIKIEVIDKEGNLGTYNKKPLTGVLFSRYDYVNNTRTKAAKLKTQIYQNYLDGKDSFVRINSVIGGLIKMDDISAINDVRKVLKNQKKITIGIHDGDEIVIGHHRENPEMLVDYSTGKSGRVYVAVNRGFEGTSAIKVNVQNLIKSQAGILYDVYKGLLDNTLKLDTILDLKDVKGLTVKQFLDLLVYEGEVTTNRKYKDAILYIKTARNTKRGIYFGDKFLDPTVLDKAENKIEFISHVMANMKQRVNAKQINKPIDTEINTTPFSGSNISFTWFGKKYNVSDSYNNFLFDSAIKTNIKTNQDNIFESPDVFLATDVIGQDTKTTKERRENEQKKKLPPTDNPNNTFFSLVPEDYVPLPGYDIEAEKVYIEKTIGLFPVDIIDGYIEIGKTKGRRATGLFKKGLVVLSRMGSKGDGAHEAYHAIEELHLTEAAVKNLDKETIELGFIPTNKDIADIKNIFPGFTTEQAKRRFYKEVRAEGMRAFQISDGATIFNKKTKKWYTKLWEWIKAVIFNRPTVDRLFRNIDKGVYFAREPLSSNLKRLTETNAIFYNTLDDEFGDNLESTLNGLTYLLLGAKEGALADIDSMEELTTRLAQGTDNLETIVRSYEDYYKEKDQKLAANWGQVLENLPALKEEIISNLGSLSLKYNEDDQKKNKDILAATKASFELASKENANLATKLFLYFVPKLQSINLIDGKYDYVMNNFLNIPEFEDSTAFFQSIQNAMADSEGYYQVLEGENKGPWVSPYEIMISKLRALSKTIPSAKYVENKLESGSEQLRTSFEVSLGLQTLNHTASDFRGGQGRMSWRTNIGVQANHTAQRLRTEWKQNFRRTGLYDTTKEGIVASLPEIAKIVSIWSTWKKGINRELKQNNGRLTDSLLQELISQLGMIGVRMSPEGLKHFMLTSSHKKYIKDKEAEFQKFVIKQGREPSKEESLELEDVVMGKLFRTTANKINKVFESIAQSSSKFDQLDFETNNPIHDERIIMKLARSEAQFNTVFSENTVKAGNKTYWGLSLNHYMSQIINSLKGSSWEAIKLQQSVFHKGSKWLRNLREDVIRNNVRINLFNTFKRTGSSLVKKWHEMEQPDELAYRINKSLAGEYNGPSYADKPTNYTISGLPQIDLTGMTIDINTDDKITIPGSVSDLFSRYFQDEYTRIAQTEKQLFGDNRLDDNQLYVYYHYKMNKGKKDRTKANALKLYAFPNTKNWNVNIFKSNGRTYTNLPDLDLVRTNIDKDLVRGIHEEVKYALDTGIIHYNKAGDLVNNSIDPKLLQPFINRYGSVEGGIYGAMAHYTMQEIIANQEYYKLYFGDPAFYKSLPAILKRTPEIIATGQKLASIVREYFTAAVVNDVERKSKNYDIYVDSFKNLLNKSLKDIKEMLRPYLNVNTTDAQAYITLERWKELMRGLRKWKDKMEPAFQRLLRGKGTDSDMKMIIAQPLKGMFFGLRPIKLGKISLMVPTYLKYSQAVLFPQVTKENSELRSIYDSMVNQKVDELIFLSGVKNGALSPINLFSDKEHTQLNEGENLKFNKMKLENRFWKLQQDLSPHEANKTLEGSQVQKNILAVDLTTTTEFRGEEVPTSKLVELFHKSTNDKSRRGRNKLLRELKAVYDDTKNVFHIGNIEKLMEMVVKSMEKTSNGIPDNIKESLLQFSTHINPINKKEYKVLKNPLDGHPFRKRIMPVLSSIVQKATVDLETPGGAYIQVSGLGHRNKKLFTDLTKKEQSGIEYIREEEVLSGPTMKDGKVQAATIFLPHYFKKAIPNYRNMSREEIGQYITDSRLLEGVSYRIPNQGYASIDAFDVGGFLPQSVGDQVVVYNDLTAKTSADFDIDKLYLLLPSFDVDKETGKISYVEYDESLPMEKNSLKALDNYRIEIYRALLMAPHNFVELMTPLDYSSNQRKRMAGLVVMQENKDMLVNKGVYKKLNTMFTNKDPNFADEVYEAVDVQNNLGMLLPSYYMDTKVRFSGGKAGTGQKSNHLVDLPMRQWNPNGEPLTLDYYIGIGNLVEKDGTKLTTFSSLKDVNDESIPQVFNGRLSGYLDIANDPWIFDLNNNTLTANLVSMLDAAGVDPNWVDLFISHPILKEFVRLTKNSQGNTANRELLKVGNKYVVVEDYLENKVKSALKEVGIEFDKDDIISLAGARVEKYLSFDLLKEALVYNYDDTENKIGKKLFPAQIAYTVLETFKSFQSDAKELNRGVLATKNDVNGPAGGLIESVVVQNKIDEVREIAQSPYSVSKILGFDSKIMEGTMEHTFFNNGAKLMLELFGPLTVQATPAFLSALTDISNQLGKARLTDPKLAAIIADELYAALVSKSSYGKSRSQLSTLFYGKSSVAYKVSELKLSGQKFNKKLQFFLDFLQPVIQEDTQVSFIVADNIGAKEKTIYNKLVQGFREGLNHSDEKVKKIFEDLVHYAYYTSGFKTNLTAIHEYIPYEYDSEIMKHGEFLQNARIASSVDKQGLEYNTDYFASAIDEVYLNNTHNRQLVPVLREEDKKKSSKEDLKSYVYKGKKTSVVTKIRTSNPKLQIRKEDNDITYRPYITYRNKDDDQVYTYKYAGQDNKQVGTYIIVPKRGLRRGKHLIKEYYFDSDKPSAFKENQLPFDKPQEKEILGITILAEDETSRIKVSSSDETGYESTDKIEILEDPTIEENEEETEGGGENDDYLDFSGTSESYHLDKKATLKETIDQLTEISDRVTEEGSRYIYKGGGLTRFIKNKLMDKQDLTLDQVNLLNDYIVDREDLFVGKKLPFIAQSLVYEALQANADYLQKANVLDKAADEKLDKFLLSELKKYKVESAPTTLRAIKEKYGTNALGVADILHKTLHYVQNPQDRDRIVIPEEFGHFFTILAGPRNRVVQDIASKIETWDKYNEIFNDYKRLKNYQKKDGTPDTLKIKFEAIGRLIGEAIVARNEDRKISVKDWLMNRAMDLIDWILSIFKAIKNPVPLDILSDRIAQEVLAGNMGKYTDIYDKPHETEYKLVNYEKTIKNYPEAATLISIMSEFGASLTGSLALRKQGMLFRSDNETLHDFDFKINHKVWKKQGMESFINKIQKIIPELRTFNKFVGTSGDTVYNLTITKDEALHNKFAELKGDFTQRLDQLTSDERDNLILIDFFFQTTPFRTIPFKSFVHWVDTWEAKMNLARSKDIYDYQMWETTMPDVNTNKDSRFIFYSLPTKISVRTDAKKYLERATKDKNLRYYKGSFYGLKYDLGKSQLALRDINNSYFDGARVLYLKNQTFAQTVQAVVQIDPTAYIQAEKANQYRRTGIQLDIFEAMEKQQTPYDPRVDKITSIKVPIVMKKPVDLSTDINNFINDMSIFYEAIVDFNSYLKLSDLKVATMKAMDMINTAYKTSDNAVMDALSEVETDIDIVLNNVSDNLGVVYEQWASANNQDQTYIQKLLDLYGFRKGIVRREGKMPRFKPMRECK